MVETTRSLTKEEYEEICRLAQIASPRPATDPVISGLWGLIVAWFIFYVLSKFVDWGVDDLLLTRLAFLTWVVGFLIGYTPVKMKHRAHERYLKTLLDAKKSLVEGKS